MPRLNQNRVKITLWFQDEVLQAIKAISTARGVTYSELIREACRLYVLSNGPQASNERSVIQRVMRG